MIVPQFVRQWYDEANGPARVLQGIVRDTLTTFCEQNNYQLVDRVKGLQSCAEKMESGRFARPADIDDLYAATIVVPSLAHDDEVVRFLESSFKREALKGRARTSKDPETFRFDATRFYGRLKPSSIGRDPRLDEMLFEIQVHTAFEHAWITVTHNSVYKSNAADWRRKRLAASLKASVEQLDLLVVGFDQAASQITPSFWLQQALRQRVIDTFGELFRDRRLDDVLVPESLSRFADNFVQLCESEARARNGRTKVKPETIVDEATRAIRSHVSNAGWTCPRSVSLFQAVLGILVTEGVLASPHPQYGSIATDDLCGVFPKVGLWRR